MNVLKVYYDHFLHRALCMKPSKSSSNATIGKMARTASTNPDVMSSPHLWLAANRWKYIQKWKSTVFVAQARRINASQPHRYCVPLSRYTIPHFCSPVLHIMHCRLHAKHQWFLFQSHFHCLFCKMHFVSVYVWFSVHIIQIDNHLLLLLVDKLRFISFSAHFCWLVFFLLIFGRVPCMYVCAVRWIACNFFLLLLLPPLSLVHSLTNKPTNESALVEQKKDIFIQICGHSPLRAQSVMSSRWPPESVSVLVRIHRAVSCVPRSSHSLRSYLSLSRIAINNKYLSDSTVTCINVKFIIASALPTTTNSRMPLSAASIVCFSAVVAVVMVRSCRA